MHFSNENELDPRLFVIQKLWKNIQLKAANLFLMTKAFLKTTYSHIKWKKNNTTVVCFLLLISKSNLNTILICTHSLYTVNLHLFNNDNNN